jgi:outer membrane protein
MKKHVFAAVITATFSMPSMADFLGIFAGLDYRNNETSYANNSDDSNNLAGYIAFEHFMPLIPNVKVKSAYLNGNDNGNSATNAILYYEIFDNGIFEFDAGLAYTNIKSSYDDMAIVQGYAASKLHFPVLGLNAFAEITKASINDDDATQTEIGMAYNFNPNSPVLNFALRGGYRKLQANFDSNSATQTTKGTFIGLEVHF